jgi:hypothetical protein
MRPSDCTKYQTCSAPLCPLDEDSLRNAQWYPDEEICLSQEYFHLNWIRNQKKIASKCRNTDFYFTLGMLSHNCVIGKKIEGIDPDHDLDARESDEARWLKEHPEKPKMSDEKKQELLNRFHKTKPGIDPLK